MIWVLLVVLIALPIVVVPLGAFGPVELTLWALLWVGWFILLIRSRRRSA